MDKDLYQYYKMAGEKDDLFNSKDTRAERQKAKLIKKNLGHVYNRGLDIGTSEGLHTQLLTGVCNEVIACDISRERLIKLRDKYYITNLVVQCDIEHLPFKDQSFDIIMATEVLEHIPDDKRALRVIWDCLIYNGMIIISVPNKVKPDKTGDRLSKALGLDIPKYGHLRTYNKFTLRVLLRETRFIWVRIKEFNKKQNLFCIAIKIRGIFD